MKANNRLYHIILFLSVVLAQVFIFDKLLILNNVVPYVYPLFIILQPPHANRIQTLILAFLLGFSIDMFQNTGGMHATASLVIAYFRPQLLHFNFVLSYDYQTLSINNAVLLKKISYVFLVILLHHVILFSLEFFNINLWQLFLEKLITSTLLSVLVNILILQLLQKQIK